MDAERQERTVASRELHRRPGRRIGADIHRILAEIDERNRGHEEDDQDRDSKQRHNDGDRERQLDATRIETDEDDVAEDPIDRLEHGGVSKIPVR